MNKTIFKVGDLVNYYPYGDKVFELEKYNLMLMDIINWNSDLTPSELGISSQEIRNQIYKIELQLLADLEAAKIFHQAIDE